MTKKIIIWWKKQPCSRKIIGFIIIGLILLFAFTNRSISLDIIGWISVIWRAETAIVYWKLIGKPLWQLLIIRSILDFWGLFIGWTLLGFALKITTLRKNNRFIQKLIQNFEEKEKNPKFQRKLNWFEKKENLILYLLMFVPIIPFIGGFVVIVARIRRIKHGLLILGLINFIKNSLYVWLLWRGISFFT